MAEFDHQVPEDGLGCPTPVAGRGVDHRTAMLDERLERLAELRHHL